MICSLTGFSTRRLRTQLLLHLDTFVSTYLSIYKGTLSSGGVMWERGLTRVRGVGTKAKRLGLVRKRSSVRTCLSTIKSPWSVKCNRPINVAKRPSKKS